jgi:hypothetical protein
MQSCKRRGKNDVAAHNRATMQLGPSFNRSPNPTTHPLIVEFLSKTGTYTAVSSPRFDPTADDPTMNILCGMRTINVRPNQASVENKYSIYFKILVTEIVLTNCMPRMLAGRREIHLAVLRRVFRLGFLGARVGRNLLFLSLLKRGRKKRG